jgi:hypothetical protein
MTMHRLTQSIVSFVLCLAPSLAFAPLLAAQQATGTIVPKGTRIELVSLEAVSSETAARGSRIRFAVANDVAIRGVTVIRAGTPVFGTITKAKRGIANEQWPTLRIHVNGVRIGQGIDLPLSLWAPETDQSTWKYRAMCVPFFVVCLGLKNLEDNGWGEDGAPKPDQSSGQQASLPSCVVFDFWTATPVSVPPEALPSQTANSPSLAQIACHQLTDWSHAYEDPGLGRVFFR